MIFARIIFFTVGFAGAAYLALTIMRIVLDNQ